MADDVLDEDDFVEELEDDADEVDLDPDLDPDVDVDDELVDDILGVDDVEDVDDVVGVLEEEDPIEAGETTRRKALSEDDDEIRFALGGRDIEYAAPVGFMDEAGETRIAAGDDEDEEDEEEVAAADPRALDGIDGVTAKREGEFTCTSCFMVVHPRQFGRKGRPQCPYGEEGCPSIAAVFGD